MVKGLVTSAAAIAFAVIAANWLREFHDRDEKVVQDYENLKMDMTRASWIIETALELEYEHNAQVSEEWMLAVTRGLFDSQQSSKNSTDAENALKALLSYAPNIEVGPDGVSVAVNGKNAKKMSKEASASTSDN